MSKSAGSPRPPVNLARRLVLRAVAFASVMLVAFASVQAQDVIVNRPIFSPGAPDTVSPPKPKHLQGQFVIVPSSSLATPADLGKKAHTNISLLGPVVTDPMEAPPYGGYAYETPASLGCVYALVATISGCNPNSTVNNPTGGSQTIAIVDAYDDPEAPADLAYFSVVFGIPLNAKKFSVVYAGGSQPPTDYTGGWELEESLDIEYAHAMAPSATLYLVEAQSNLYSDLFNAVTEATNIIQCGNFTITVGACGSVTGKGEVSMSWGGGEFSGETSDDTYFNKTNVVFFASSGDSPGTIYPSASPNVVSVGGTGIGRSSTTGNYLYEHGWESGGGGPSNYESKPSYQSGITGTTRMTPDVAADANPTTGMWVYDSFPNDFSFSSVGWWVVGGTSASAPLWAGIVNAAGGFSTSSNAELTKLYGDPSSDFRDITYGDCGYYLTDEAVTGYDLCTGRGSPLTHAGK